MAKEKSSGPRGPKSDKIWADAVRKAVSGYYEETDAAGKVKKIRHINRIAENLVKKAGEGDIQAVKEIGERLDGKSTQPIGNDDTGPLKIVFQHVNLDDDD